MGTDDDAISRPQHGRCRVRRSENYFEQRIRRGGIGGFFARGELQKWPRALIQCKYPVWNREQASRLSRRKKNLLVPDRISALSACPDVFVRDLDRRKLPGSFVHHV